MSADNDTNAPNDFNQSGTERFDFLMARYLAGDASDPEKEELHQLTENGYAPRFGEWLDAHADTDSTEMALPGKARDEILTNILGAARPKTRRMPAWWSWAAAILLALGGLMWLTLKNNQSAPMNVTRTDSPPPKDDLQVAKGKQFLILPDGSSVLMNERAELTYSPASFQNGSREVTLQGEAYFDIAHDPSKPFRVKSGAVVTRVLGTAFNVNMLENKVVVTVARGLVEVGSTHHVYAKIRPDEQITVDTRTQQYNTASVSAIEETAWKDAYLVFDNIDLEKAGQLIGEHYGVKLAFTRAEIKKCRITASFLHHENLDTVLTVLSKMIGATYTIENGNVSIEGGSCD
ncbi:MAG: FecR domain-containing protein [Dyadobacter sp.]|uniref:FecR family protein n=1 Tax=Dyadobacter sp. TaxID=1914288 RepID=UPI001B13E43B|nr:FecR domain-containing protein [Dyadobacter sp.]MBO9616925.1 FecR domain-containing protein [Dyadobacter sp.]